MSNIELPRCYILTKLHKGKTFYFGGEEGFTQHAGEALKGTRLVLLPAPAQRPNLTQGGAR